MKKWFLILVLLFSAAVALASGEDRSTPYGEVPIAILSQAENRTATPDNTPLLATATAGSSHFSSTGHISLRGNRSQQEASADAMRHTTAETAVAIPHPGKTVYETYLPYTRAIDHYIYFLRRIVI